MVDDQRDDREPVVGLGIAAAEGGSVKSRRLGQICVGANNKSSYHRFCADLTDRPKLNDPQ